MVRSFDGFGGLTIALRWETDRGGPLKHLNLRDLHCTALSHHLQQRHTTITDHQETTAASAEKISLDFLHRLQLTMCLCNAGNSCFDAQSPPITPLSHPIHSTCTTAARVTSPHNHRRNLNSLPDPLCMTSVNF